MLCFSIIGLFLFCVLLFNSLQRQLSNLCYKVAPFLVKIYRMTATLMWHHTDKGPCFINLTFSYNITWYPVVGVVPPRGEGQSAVTGPGATEYNIINLMNGTDYQVELFGFTSSYPVVYSEVATVNFTTEGV